MVGDGGGGSQHVHTTIAGGVHMVVPVWGPDLPRWPSYALIGNAGVVSPDGAGSYVVALTIPSAWRLTSKAPCM